MSRFAAVVRRVIIEPPAGLEERLCPDQCVGTLGQLRADRKIVTRQTASARPNAGSVLLVLESPHIREFDDLPGPAKGTTGRLIAQQALSVPGLEGRDDAPLVLMNAIQYQCSLGRAPKLYRDQVFLAAWHDFGRSDFVARLSATYRENDVVVCACTEGTKGTSKPLRTLVYAAMIEALPAGTPILPRTHPSSWFSKVTRESKWVGGHGVRSPIDAMPSTSR